MGEVALGALVTLTVLWVLVMILILFLNLPVGYIFWSSHQLQSPKNMYIASMIVSDIMLGLVIPVKLYKFHSVMHDITIPNVLCNGYYVLQTFLIYVNLYSVLGLTLVRHRYITQSKEFRQSRREASNFIAFIWVASLVAAIRLPYVMSGDNETVGRVLCSSPAHFRPKMEVYFFLVDFCIPLATIYILCIHANQHLQRAEKANDPFPVEGAACRRHDCRVVRMVMALAICFLLLQLPVSVIRIVSSFKNDREMLIWLEAGHLLMFSTGASNIIVYAVFNRQAAAMLLALMKLHRGSQVGVAATDTHNVNIPPTRPALSTLRQRVNTVASILFRSSTPTRSSLSPTHVNEEVAHPKDCSATGARNIRVCHVNTTFNPSAQLPVVNRLRIVE